MPIRVVASVIRRDASLLLCQRPAHKRHGGLWEFPGGKVEPGESDLDAARRELREELGVDVLGAGAVAFSALDPGSDFQIDFVPVWIVGEPRCIEHPRVEWIRDDALLTLPLAPSDRRYAEQRAAPVGSAGEAPATGGRGAVSDAGATGTTRSPRPLAGWGALWGVPDLADTTTVTFSKRLKRSLGRCRPASGRITLQAALENAGEAVLREVLCHEAAHVAAHRLSAGAAAPHGALWQQLVRAAGFEPRTRRTAALPADAPVAERAARFPYEHRCPVCHTVRYARRRTPSWRCADCVDSGLGGELVIRRTSDPGER